MVISWHPHPKGNSCGEGINTSQTTCPGPLQQTSSKRLSEIRYEFERGIFLSVYHSPPQRLRRHPSADIVITVCIHAAHAAVSSNGHTCATFHFSALSFSALALCQHQLAAGNRFHCERIFRCIADRHVCKCHRNHRAQRNAAWFDCWPVQQVISTPVE